MRRKANQYFLRHVWSLSVLSAVVGLAGFSITSGDDNKKRDVDLVAELGTNVSFIKRADDLAVLHRPQYSDLVTTVGGEPLAIAAADFNLDGRLDFAVPSFDLQFLFAVISTPSGTYDVGAVALGFTTGIATGDFNDDMVPDIVTSQGGNTVCLLLGNGDGTFDLGDQFVAGDFVYSITVADLNDDGHEDLLVGFLNTDSGGNYSVLLGQPAGAFTVAETAGFGAGITSAVGDFNEDQHLDAVFVGGASGQNGFVQLSFGDGTGRLQPRVPAQSFDVGIDPRGVVAADFDKDTHLDIAVANFSSDDISILYGKGDGTFDSEIRYAVGTGPIDIDAEDLNEDGYPEIVVSNSTDNEMSIFVGREEGGFDVESLATTHSPARTVVADFNNDGIVDIGTASMSVPHLSVYLGHSPGSFLGSKRQDVDAGPNADMFATGNFTADANVDVVVIDSAANTATVFVGNGLGGLTQGVQLPTGMKPTSVLTMDFNQDDRDDFLVTNEDSSDLSLYLGNEAGTFEPEEKIGVAFTPRMATASDYNNDGMVDLAVAGAEGTVAVLIASDDGEFVLSGQHTVGADPYSIVTDDINSDEFEDLIVLNRSSVDVSLLLGAEGGAFLDETRVDLGRFARSLTTGDVDRDGNTDIVLAGPDIVVLLGDGSGQFQPGIEIDAFDTIWVETTDLDNDGRVDIAAASTSERSIQTSLAPGEGHFAIGDSYGVPEPPLVVRTPDLDGDARQDLVALTRFTGKLSVVLNQGPFAFGFEPDKQTVAWPIDHGASGYSVYRGTVDDLRQGAGYGHCISGPLGTTSTNHLVDGQTPSSGETFFYLFTPVSQAGEGTLGESSAGTERSPSTQCK